MTRTASRKTAQTSKVARPTKKQEAGKPDTDHSPVSGAKTRKAQAQPEAAPSVAAAPTHHQLINDAAPIISGKAGPRPGSKLAQVIGLLQREGGAALAELNSATGWLPHTTRAALTGLRKRGMALERLCDPDGTNRYHLARAS